MNAKYIRSFLVGVFVLNLLSSGALADTAASAVQAASGVQATSATPADPKKLMDQADKAMDDEQLDTAMKLYHQAAELNYTPAQVAIGELAYTAQFNEEAVGWFLMAAMQGDLAGQYNLAQMYLTGTGIEKDNLKALYWIRRSAAKNYIPSVEMIAKAYESGGFSGLINVDKDQAKFWNTKALRLRAIQQKEIEDERAKFAASQKKSKEDEAAKKANINK